MSVIVPVIPDSAPFTPEQRAYLNGFLAGLYSYAEADANSRAQQEEGPKEPLTILFASQTGTAEKLAKQAVKRAKAIGFEATAKDLADFELDGLQGCGKTLIIASTYGEGDPPDGAKTFWDALSSGSPQLPESFQYSVCALGDSNYVDFCQFGKDLDTKFQELGAARIHDRTDCDVDYEEPFEAWLQRSLEVLKPAAAPALNGAPPPETDADTLDTEPSKERPALAKLTVNDRLSGPNSNKDVRHYEISIAGLGVTYNLGDAIGVFPTNDPEQVDALLKTLGKSGSEEITWKRQQMSAQTALLKSIDISIIPKTLLDYLAEAIGETTLLQALGIPDLTAFRDYTEGRDLRDLFETMAGTPIDLQGVIDKLRPMQPRLYSIASSPNVHPDSIHLTVSTVRYETHGRQRIGVCSTFLAERAELDAPQLPIYIHSNTNFRPPPDDQKLIMVGPGTGIAPFVGFLDDRRYKKATGGAWLFFGDQSESADYLYRDRIKEFLEDGVLERLDLAWSRDQERKIYVQDRMRENGEALFEWLEDNAAFYVCGDASRMAADVERELLNIISKYGDLSEEDAQAYLENLRKTGRYRRDVY